MSRLLRPPDGGDDDLRMFHRIYAPVVFQLARKRQRLDMAGDEVVVRAGMGKSTLVPMVTGALFSSISRGSSPLCS
jgi:hypothetical protein